MLFKTKYSHLRKETLIVLLVNQTIYNVFASQCEIIVKNLLLTLNVLALQTCLKGGEIWNI